MNNPKISIIVPVYNAERYIEQCIYSVLNQTFKDYELILIDDGSKDGSLGLCEKLRETDSRIIIYSQKNKGVSTARNKGIELAKGDWISFLDSDDYFLQEYLSDSYNSVVNSDIDFLIQGFTRFNENGTLENNIKIELDDIVSAKDYYQIFEIQKFTNKGNPFSKLFKTDIIKNNKIIFPIDLTLGEDLCFNLLYLSCSSKVKFEKKYNYYYRETFNSLSVGNITFETYYLRHLRILDIIKNKYTTIYTAILYSDTYKYLAHSLGLRLYDCYRVLYLSKYNDRIDKMKLFDQESAILLSKNVSNSTIKATAFLLKHEKYKLIDFLLNSIYTVRKKIK
ncbi:glycosyltransferase family 2 protein [Dysgonomonas capnocytophagoides]|uniref:glycosyltransferase family 2 protein n=1 Tax=Dysgonomonas capnocytophagoides TaxID=45254 RepID=UPI00333FC036